MRQSQRIKWLRLPQSPLALFYIPLSTLRRRITIRIRRSSTIGDRGTIKTSTTTSTSTNPVPNPVFNMIYSLQILTCPKKRNNGPSVFAIYLVSCNYRHGARVMTNRVVFFWKESLWDRLLPINRLAMRGKIIGNGRFYLLILGLSCRFSGITPSGIC